RVRHGAHRLPPRALLGEVLSRRHPVSRLRRGIGLHVSLVGLVHRDRVAARLRRDAALHHRAGRGADVRLAKEGNRMGLDFTTSGLADAITWARKCSLFQYPFVTACCGMEFMAVAAPKYDIARFGAEFPRFSPRQADLLIIVGTITEKMGPVLARIYEQ